MRVVDDRRKEIHSLHERRSAAPPVHTRIVSGPEVDEDTVIVDERDATQDLGELAGGEFARSTGAGGVVDQSFLHDDRVGCHLILLSDWIGVELAPRRNQSPVMCS
jgi:hypothetical protein